MESNDELKVILKIVRVIISMISYYEFDFYNILLDEKLYESSYENILIYDILYKTFMGAKALCIRLGKVDEFI